jgi:transcription initiation factor TFIIIB Brf1 subunit/transcription initiation factor TFIIB
LIAAKLEQPQVPNYQNMIYAYDDLKGQEDSTLTKADIKQMEEKILVQLGFDFNFSSPRHFLDRFIRILDVHCSEDTKTLALQILVLQQVNEKMLAYSGSQIAAASLILAINQQNMHELVSNIEKGMPSESQQKFLYSSKDNICMIQEPAEMPLENSVPVNTDIWNNKRVGQMTGYTIEMLREPLYRLAEFIKANLVPNHLQYF